MTDTRMLIVAGYQDVDLAEQRVPGAGGQGRLEGAALRRHDPGRQGQGREPARGRHGQPPRAGAAPGGVAAPVSWSGCAAPPMLGAVAVGAAAGAVVGHFAGHKLTSAIQEQIGAALKNGTAAIIGVFPAADRLAVEQSLPGSPLKSVVESDEGGIDELKAKLAEAMGKFSPDRTILPVPDRAFGGAIGHTIDQSVGDWSIVAGNHAPEGAPNVLIVLIDDAGFGGPDTFGGDIRTPNLTRVQQRGHHLQPVPRDGGVLADAGRAADRSQPPPGRHGRHRRVPRAVPGLHRDPSAHRAPLCRASSRRTATRPAGSASGT